MLPDAGVKNMLGTEPIARVFAQRLWARPLLGKVDERRENARSGGVRQCGGWDGVFEVIIQRHLIGWRMG